jgi:hypothetical protein
LPCYVFLNEWWKNLVAEAALKRIAYSDQFSAFLWCTGLSSIDITKVVGGQRMDKKKPPSGG